MYARNIKSIEIAGVQFHLIALGGVPTWCYASGKVVTDQATTDTIRDHEWNRA